MRARHAIGIVLAMGLLSLAPLVLSRLYLLSRQRTIESRVRGLPVHATPAVATRMIGRPMFHCSSAAEYRSFVQSFGPGYRVPEKMPGREALVYKVSDMVQLTIVFFDDRSRLSEAHLITRGRPGVRLR